MAEETLVENLVADSVELIKRSTNKGTTPPMSFGTSILMRKNGAYLLRDRPSTSLPKDEHQAYQRIAKAIRDAKLKTLTIADVKLIRTDDAVLKATRFALKITAVRCGSDVFS